MKLQNEFTVAAPLERTWDLLLDIQRVAQCLPGATIEPADDGVYHGKMKMRLGPMTLDYKGAARLAEVDDDDHVATIDVKGKEARGQGTASATIRNRVEPADGGTRVVVETDLNITGRPAQFGRGIMEDVASRMLGDFAKRLEQELQEEPQAAPAQEAPQPVAGTRAAAAPVTPAGTAGAESGGEAPSGAPSGGGRAAADDDEVLDLGSAVGGPVAKRAAVAAAGVLVLVAVVIALRPRRRGLAVTFSYR